MWENYSFLFKITKDLKYFLTHNFLFLQDAPIHETMKHS